MSRVVLPPRRCSSNRVRKTETGAALLALIGPPYILATLRWPLFAETRLSDDPKQQQPSTDDRRSQLGLRALIDEMLQQVRELNRHAATWDPDERAKAEQQLEMIMARVRDEASRGHTKPA